MANALPPQTPTPETVDLTRLRSVRRPMRLGTLRTMMALMLREMTTTYGRSPGGYIWTVLEPVAGIAVLTAVFSAGFRNPALGTNFAIFYATGMIPFLAFNDISGKMSQSINYSRQLLAYPRVTYIDTLMARFVLNMLTQMLVAYLVISGILLLFDTRTTLVMSQILLSFAMVGALAAGIGIFNCLLMMLYPIWQRAWTILTRPLFFISGVFFTYETIPQPYREYFWYNPLIHVIGTMRSGFYISYEATYVSPLYVFGIALVTGVTGLVFLRRYYKDIMEL